MNVVASESSIHACNCSSTHHHRLCVLLHVGDLSHALGAHHRELLLELHLVCLKSLGGMLLCTTQHSTARQTDLGSRCKRPLRVPWGGSIQGLVVIRHSPELAMAASSL